MRPWTNTQKGEVFSKKILIKGFANSFEAILCFMTSFALKREVFYDAYPLSISHTTLR